MLKQSGIFSIISATLLTLFFSLISLEISAQAILEPVKVGLIVPLSGPWARPGQVMRVAAELAVEEINEQGGIAALGGAPLELVVYDAGDNVERAKNAAQRMVAEEPDLIGAVGAYLSSFTLAVTEVTERAEVPILTLSYSDLITSRGFNYVFQTSASGAVQSSGALPVLMDMAESASGHRPETIAIIMDNTAASEAFVKPFFETNILEEYGLELVVNEVFTPPLANATSLIQHIRAEQPDLLLLLPTAISDTKLLLEKMNEFRLGRGLIPTISNGAAMGDPDLLSNMPGFLLEGVMSIVANWSTRGQEELIDKFKDVSGEPWMTQHPLSTYGHVWLFKQALEQSSSRDSTVIANTLRNMTLSDGAVNYFPGNSLSFDQTGKRIDAGILVIQWQEGEPITVFPEREALRSILWPGE
ncbi:MAG: branched-chain amino acid ABC transporter substrate-binding protein [SAR86 cluster bacterium]|uniref:Branched-chain amino acid ABC transporter substrate-binding protein n=1 Tax=SAR86 cluster bacterium TaxID=2030880 RepID=A0A2A5C8G8_9GAMM|nr:MAG: branched-chain amino acid ABC transporter substrate-binding protein [SAR86 cluster bacterium]